MQTQLTKEQVAQVKPLVAKAQAAVKAKSAGSKAPKWIVQVAVRKAGRRALAGAMRKLELPVGGKKGSRDGKLWASAKAQVGLKA